jgi:hypothetical protein
MKSRLPLSATTLALRDGGHPWIVDTVRDEVRPDVVHAIFAAAIDPDLGGLTQLGEFESVTPAEGAAAGSLLLTALSLQAAHAARRAEALDILWRHLPAPAARPWPELFDSLTYEDVERLRELYPAMPDGARDEFDRRYGRPQL